MAKIEKEIESQEDLIIAYLKSKPLIRINHKIARKKPFLCERLASRISNLRLHKGHSNIKKEMVWNKAKTKRYAEYFIPLQPTNIN